MKNKFLKSAMLFLGVVLLGLSACKKESDKVPFDEVCFASFNYANRFEGEDGGKYNGPVQDGPTKISVKTGAWVELFTQTDNFHEYDSDDEIKRVFLEIKNDDGVVRSSDLIGVDALALKVGSNTLLFPAERSCDVNVTFYSKKGASCTKKLRVNVTDANETYINDIHIINYSPTDDFSFFAPYNKQLNDADNDFVRYDYNQGVSLYGKTLSLYAALGIELDGGTLKLMSADVFKSNNYTAEPEFGFNGVEMELLNIPNYTDEWGGDYSEFENFLVANNLRTYAQLEAMTFNNPVKTLTLQDNQLFKFRTLSGKKGIAVARLNGTDNSYSNFMFVLQR
ncbi:MAG: hypothetical protein H3C31_05575 [Brumimicrobium sp.]|nr:hypothetical protein [Brumimicrobium sp.]